MKKIFWIFSVAAMAISVASCDPKKEEPTPLDDITEDGFYVIGEATGKTEVTGVLAMAKGINEWGSDDLGIKSQQVRDGMFEKYIVLEGGKEFTLAYVNGGQKTAYGANLKAFKPAAIEGDYADNPADGWFVGKLEVGNSAPKMKMEKTGLYHIVLDLNNDKLLTDAQILVSPVTWGVRGGMNSWNFTALEATAPSNDGITYTLSGQKLADGGEFKFAYNGGWKIFLGKNADGTKFVKANTNIGKDCKPGGDNIAVTEGAGAYKITLNYKLAAGDVAKSFSYTITQESKSETPTTMYMIGQDFGGWDWGNAGVAELVPVWGKEGAFWCTRYFTTNGFKFCALKEWNGDFTGLGNDSGYTVAEGNCFVPEAGMYTVYINLLDKVLEIKPAEVYGLGDAVFTGGWDFDTAQKCEIEDGKAVIVTKGAGELRLASKVMPTTKVEGCVDFGWYDWWKTEFIFFDGKIAYRGGGNDQERVQIEAGKKIIIDFNAGTVEVVDGAAEEGAIKIDGDLSDWDAIDTQVASTKDTPVYALFKVTNDKKNIYFYTKRDTRDAIWSRGGYVYYDIDADNNPATGVNKEIDGLEMWLYFFPFDGKEIATDVGSGDAYPSKAVFNNFKFAGKVGEEWVEVEASMPLADAGIKSGDVIAVYSWSNKSGDDLKKTPIVYTVK